MIRLLAALLLLPICVAAGPWLREEGTTFLSYSRTVGDKWEQSAYVEWGKTPKTTLGFDVWRSDDGRKLRAVSFARRSLGERNAWVFAAEAGMGTHVDFLPQGSRIDTVARLGVSAGRPLPDGWFVVDVQVDRFVQYSKDWEGKLTLTAGHNLTDRWALMGQAVAETGSAMDPGRTASATAIWRLSPRLRLAATAARDILPAPKSELRLAVWAEF